MTKFETPALQRAYDVAVKAFHDKQSYLYADGKPLRGSSDRHSFWNGFNGHPPRHAKTSIAYATWAAGRDMREQARRPTDQDVLELLTAAENGLASMMTELSMILESHCKLDRNYKPRRATLDPGVKRFVETLEEKISQARKAIANCRKPS